MLAAAPLSPVSDISQILDSPTTDYLNRPQQLTIQVATMCNTIHRPDHSVSAPFRRLNSSNYLKEPQPIKSECENIPMPIQSATIVSPADVPKKPMRPLTAYHIYFQIEREFILQTMAGEDANKSINEGKSCRDDVPERYRAIKLSPDWYFGPGKRAKRKHRKQHGKIGFLELSRVISTRWAELDQTDPDIKNFASKLAKKELEEYQRDVEKYKELTKDMIPIAPPVKSAVKKDKKRKRSEQQQQEEEVKQMQQQQQQECMRMIMSHQMVMAPQPTPAMLSSFYGADQPVEDKSFMNNSVKLRQEIDQLKNEIEYVNSCLDKYTQHFITQPTPTFTRKNSAPPKKQFFRRKSSDISLSFLDSIMDEMAQNEPATKKAKSPTTKNFKNFYRRQSSTFSLSFLDPLVDKLSNNDEHFPFIDTSSSKETDHHSSPVNVADVDDGDIMSLWMSQNSY